MRLRALLPAALAVAFAGPLAGCGFSPMYGGSGGPGGSGVVIGPVAIDEIPGKAGFVLKAELEKLLAVEREGTPRHLKISVGESVGGLGFRVDESASRSDLRLNANYVLSDSDGKTVAAGSISAVASYDVPASTFGEIAAQDDARERAAENAAEQIRAHLAMQLARKKPATP